MSDNNEQIEQIEVDVTKVSKGKITYGNINNPTPTILARATRALRYFSVSLITMISGTDLFSGAQVKVAGFCLGVFILLLGAVDLVVGVKPEESK